MEKMQKGENQLGLMDLLTSLLHNILSRLPINSIMKLKLVCKPLYNLISHPDFTRIYTKSSPFATLLFPTNPWDDTYGNLDLLQVSNTYECIRTRFKPRIPDVSGFTLAGTCNGLSVRNFRTDEGYVCNPITGQYVALPEKKIGRNCTSVYGFGFCKSTKNYKVLRMVYNQLKGPEIWENGQILTAGIDRRWRMLADPVVPYSWSCGNIIALNGALYWIVKDDESIWISRFDLNEEKVGRVSHPCGLVLNHVDMKLRSINEHLCLVDHSDPSVVVIWKMNECAGKETWTKDMILDISFRCKKILPETILQSGDIVFSSSEGSYLVLYNPTKNEVNEIQIPCYGISSYVPSLLSLKEAGIGVL